MAVFACFYDQIDGAQKGFGWAVAVCEALYLGGESATSCREAAAGGFARCPVMPYVGWRPSSSSSSSSSIRRRRRRSSRRTKRGDRGGRQRQRRLAGAKR
jgi:hypothetical protein